MAAKRFQYSIIKSQLRPSLITLLAVLLVGLIMTFVIVRPGYPLLKIGLWATVACLFLLLLKSVEISAISLEKFFFWLAFAAGFFGVALFPIDVGPFMLFPFRIFLSVLWMLFVMRVLVEGVVTIPLFMIKRYLIFLIFWNIYAIFTIVWSASKIEAIRNIVFLFMGSSLIFFATNYLQTMKDIQRLYWIWIGALFVLVLLGLWEHFTGHHLPVSGYSEERLSYLALYKVKLVQNIPTAVFTNPNDYATFLALALPFALVMIRYDNRMWIRILASILAISALYLIIITDSRANVLAFLLEVSFLGLFLTKLNKKIKLVLIGALAINLITPTLNVQISETIQRAASQIRTIQTDMELVGSSTEIRLSLAKNCLEFLYSTAGFGVGAGNVEYWMANFARHDTSGILNPHNWWLEILSNYGILIFFGYIVTYLCLLHRLWKFWHVSKDRRERMIAEALLLALIGFSIASLSSSSIMAFDPQWLLFAFIFAFIGYYGRHIKKTGRT